ncbi:hypothetical protein PoB_005696400 [Plakobranchus ocellatus]|uniref:Uncharacterized protein n=1 Tax=Plakobranchus ocellatus TaxID=259542 RepID=A0AAV4CGY3_9GAST|nr:hypothetical protein PoB_005696400 [Plakobranchus ocellatus]
MLLRSGRHLRRPLRPKMREANKSYHGHYVPLIIIRRSKREAKSLGLLDPYGQVNFQFQHPDPLPQNADTPVIQELNEGFCRASVYNKKEGERQCRRRPKRDSEFCHSHDPRYRTNNTARRMRLLAEWRQEQLDAIIARRRREREMEADARRGIVKDVSCHHGASVAQWLASRPEICRGPSVTGSSTGALAWRRA